MSGTTLRDEDCYNKSCLAANEIKTIRLDQERYKKLDFDEFFHRLVQNYLLYAYVNTRVEAQLRSFINSDDFLKVSTDELNRAAHVAKKLNKVALTNLLSSNIHGRVIDPDAYTPNQYHIPMISPTHG